MSDRLQGIILKVIPFRDHDLMLQVFSEDQGLVSLLLKGGQSQLRKTGILPEPLTEAEFIYKTLLSGLKICREMASLKLNLELRQNWHHLKAGCDLAKILHRSQIEQKPAPALYALLKSYLNYLPKSTNVAALCCSFRLKILRHEGLYPFDAPHSPYHDWFSPAERSLIEALGHQRSFAELSALNLAVHTEQRIQQLFETLIHDTA